MATLPIVLIGMAGLVLEVATRDWKNEYTIVADVAVVAKAPVMSGAPVMAESFIERRPPVPTTN
jgi:hypothetical protein